MKKVIDTDNMPESKKKVKLIDANELINVVGAKLIMEEGPFMYEEFKKIVNDQPGFEYSTEHLCADCKKFNHVISKTLEEILNERKSRETGSGEAE